MKVSVIKKIYQHLVKVSEQYHGGKDVCELLHSLLQNKDNDDDIHFSDFYLYMLENASPNKYGFVNLDNSSIASDEFFQLWVAEYPQPEDAVLSDRVLMLHGAPKLAGVFFTHGVMIIDLNQYLLSEGMHYDALVHHVGLCANERFNKVKIFGSNVKGKPKMMQMLDLAIALITKGLSSKNNLSLKLILPFLNEINTDQVEIMLNKLSNMFTLVNLTPCALDPSRLNHYNQILDARKPRLHRTESVSLHLPSSSSCPTSDVTLTTSKLSSPRLFNIRSPRAFTEVDLQKENSIVSALFSRWVTGQLEKAPPLLLAYFEKEDMCDFMKQLSADMDTLILNCDDLKVVKDVARLISAIPQNITIIKLVMDRITDLDVVKRILIALGKLTQAIELDLSNAQLGSRSLNEVLSLLPLLPQNLIGLDLRMNHFIGNEGFIIMERLANILDNETSIIMTPKEFDPSQEAEDSLIEDLYSSIELSSDGESEPTSDPASESTTESVSDTDSDDEVNTMQATFGKAM